MGGAQLHRHGRQYHPNSLEGQEARPIRNIFELQLFPGGYLLNPVRQFFTFAGKRAIVFHESADLPVGPLKHCISLALIYHRIERLPLLGA